MAGEFEAHDKWESTFLDIDGHWTFELGVPCTLRWEESGVLTLAIIQMAMERAKNSCGFV